SSEAIQFAFNDLLFYQSKAITKHMKLVKRSGQSSNFRITNFVNQYAKQKMFSVVFIENSIFDYEDANSERGINQHKLLEDMLHFVYQTGDLQQSVHGILMKLGHYIGVDRIAVYEVVEGESDLRNTYEWYKEGFEMRQYIGNRMDDVTFKNYDVVFQETMGLQIADFTKLPAEMKKYYNTINVQAVLLMPLVIDDQLKGFFSLESFLKSKKWDFLDVPLLTILFQIVTNMIFRINTENDLRMSGKAFKSILDNMEPFIIIVEPNSDQVIFANEKAKQFFGRSLVGKPCWQVMCLKQGKSCQSCLRKDAFIATDGQPIKPITTEVQNDKTGIWMQMTYNAITWVDESLVHLISGVDISQLKGVEKQLQLISSMDTMTGALNREGLQQLSDQLKLSTHQNKSMTLTFVNIMDVALINEQHGETAGDDCIKTISAIIQRNIRKSDQLIRLGGNEFMIVFYNCSQRNVQRIMHKIERLIANENSNETRPYKLSFTYEIDHANSWENNETSNLMERVEKKNSHDNH
ncbi:MAG: diguanylate cyclase, partial [Hyphomonadaceae bacterium]|nr:diguanylate cyclase [Clostridia bacterium]